MVKEKLKKLKENLKGWNQSVFGIVEANIKNIGVKSRSLMLLMKPWVWMRVKPKKGDMLLLICSRT